MGTPTWYDIVGGADGATLAATDYDPDFTGVTTAAGTLVIETTPVAFGKKHTIETANPTNAGLYANLTISSTDAVAFGWELNLDANPTVEIPILFFGTGSTRCLMVAITTAGALRVRDSANTAKWTTSPSATSSPTSLPLDTDVFVVAYVGRAASTGTYRVVAYQMSDGSILIDSGLQTGQATGAAGITNLRRGPKASSGTGAATIYGASVGVDTAASDVFTPRTSSADATVNAVPAVAMVTSPAAAVSAGSTITAAPAIVLGKVVVNDASVSMQVGLVPAITVAHAPIPTVTTTTIVQAVPAFAILSARASSVSAAATVPAVAAVGVTGTRTPSVSAGAAVVAVAATVLTGAPTPSFTRTAAPQATPAIAVASAPAPSVTAGGSATITAVPAFAVLMMPTLFVTAGSSAPAAPAVAVLAALPPRISVSATVIAVVAFAIISTRPPATSDTPTIPFPKVGTLVLSGPSRTLGLTGPVRTLEWS